MQPPVRLPAKAEADPEYRMRWDEYNRKQMETAELKNGRLAMLGITGFAFQEFVWGTPVVDQTPIFFTFFGGAPRPIQPTTNRRPAPLLRVPLLPSAIALPSRARGAAEVLAPGSLASLGVF